MDLRKTAREIGLFEMGINLSRVVGSADVRRKVGASLPLPDEDIAASVPQIAAWLHSFGKSKYLFLTPEIALIDEMAKSAAEDEEIIIAAPSDLEPDVKERMANNLPRGLAVTMLEEPFFHRSFFPGNGMIVACGYSAAGRAMVLPDTYRMIEHYSCFRGKKAFIPYVELETAARYDDWREANPQRLSMKWSCK